MFTLSKVETPGYYILDIAQVYRIKKTLQDHLSDYVYNGFWFSPKGKYAFSCVALAEENVSGAVKLEIYKGNVSVLGRKSSTSMYNEDLVSMDKHSDFSPADATGFINVHSIRLKEFAHFQKKLKKQ